MSGNANSGRRPSPPMDLEKLEELSIAQAIALLRLKGRRVTRRKLMAEITVGRLKAYLNWGRLARSKNPETGQPNPTYVIKRPDLERWRQASLTPLNVYALAR